MPKSSDLGVRQTSQKGDYCVHHILIINYAILTLSNQDSNKFTKVWTKFFPLRSRHGKGIITTVLKGIKRTYEIWHIIAIWSKFSFLPIKEHFLLRSRCGQILKVTYTDTLIALYLLFVSFDLSQLNNSWHVQICYLEQLFNSLF